MSSIAASEIDHLANKSRVEPMTDLLEQAVEAVRQMPAAEQDSIAHAMLSLAKIGEPLDIEPEHRAAVAEGMAQAARGEFVDGSAGDIITRAFQRART